MQPNTRVDQDQITDFMPDEKIFFAVGNAQYDNVWKIDRDD